MNRLRTNALLITVALFVADRASKLWIESHLTLHDSFSVIPGIFNIVHTQNPGAAFGMFATASPAVRFGVLIVASLAMMGIIAQMLWQATASVAAASTTLRLALTLVLGGALGNLYDRLRFDRVTDFLQVFLGSYEWPSFNVADSAICVGATLLAIDMLWGRARQTTQVRTS
jgi:signal peptidase II